VVGDAEHTPGSSAPLILLGLARPLKSDLFQQLTFGKGFGGFEPVYEEQA
jgi:hypothetical protein